MTALSFRSVTQLAPPRHLPADRHPDLAYRRDGRAFSAPFQRAINLQFRWITAGLTHDQMDIMESLSVRGRAVSDIARRALCSEDFVYETVEQVIEHADRTHHR